MSIILLNVFAGLSIPQWFWAFLFTISVTLVALIIALRKDREQLKKQKFLLIFGFLLSVTLAGIVYYQQDQLAEERKKQIIYLQGQQQDLLDGNIALLGNFDVIKSMADTILAEVRSNETSESSRVVLPLFPAYLFEIKEKRIEMNNPRSGISISNFYFRSIHVSPLRDIRIEMIFENPVKYVTSRLIGAFVIEQATMDTLIEGTKYVFTTGYLSQSNDIEIAVESETPIKLIDLKLSP